MAGHGELGLEAPVVIDGATDITAEGGIGAASRSTLGLTGSSMMRIKHSVKNDISQKVSTCCVKGYMCEYLVCVNMFYQTKKYHNLKFCVPGDLYFKNNIIIYGKGSKTILSAIPTASMLQHR